MPLALQLYQLIRKMMAKKENRGEKIDKDRLYSAQRNSIADFNFGKETTLVFDDMLDRSVPFYSEIQRMICELATEFAIEGTNVYDLGCSTCNTFIALDKILPPSLAFIGLDSSAEMLKEAQRRLDAEGFSRKVELHLADLNQEFAIENASVVVMNLTLQFIRPLYRQTVIEMISRGLNENGCLILVEKILSPDSRINRSFIKLYHDFKRRKGYSALEIAQKREALENVLVPYNLNENQDLLLSHGFRSCEPFFKWYNFCGLLALK